MAGTAFADEGIAPVAPLVGANVGLIADSATGSAAVIDGVVGIDYARFQAIADVSYGQTAPFSKKLEWFGVATVGRFAVLPFRVTPVLGLGVTYSVFEGSRGVDDVVEGKGFGLLGEGGLMIRLQSHRLTGVLRGNLGPHDVQQASGRPLSGLPFQLGLLVGYAYAFR